MVRHCERASRLGGPRRRLPRAAPRPVAVSPVQRWWLSPCIFSYQKERSRETRLKVALWRPFYVAGCKVTATAHAPSQPRRPRLAGVRTCHRILVSLSLLLRRAAQPCAGDGGDAAGRKGGAPRRAVSRCSSGSGRDSGRDEKLLSRTEPMWTGGSPFRILRPCCFRIAADAGAPLAQTRNGKVTALPWVRSARGPGRRPAYRAASAHAAAAVAHGSWVDSPQLSSE